MTEPRDIVQVTTAFAESADFDATLAPDAARRQAIAANQLNLPGYEILDVLGRGGMAVVYKARQHSLRRIVAIKVILAGAHASPEEIMRFRIEGESVARMHHPHIVQIHEVGQHDGCPYCALEFVDGGTLAARLRGKPMSSHEAAELAEKMARAIHAAHQHGVVHRDLKPGNILMTAEGEPKVTDFGLAKWMDDDTGQTKTGAVMGTPAYMAPEQAEGRKDIGPAADVYGLGAILYEMLTGRPPFHADTSLDTVLKVVSEEPIPPRKLVPQIPRELETICLKCLEKDAHRRYETAEALSADLGRFIRGEPIQARPPGWLGRLDRWARLRPALAATLVALTILYVEHLILIAVGVEGEGGAFHWFVTGIVAAWAAGAAILQWLVVKMHRPLAFTYAWAAFDVLMFTAILLLGDGPKSALLPAYLLLIAGTALRLSVWLVWFVTGLCMMSFGLLLCDASWRRPDLVAEPKVSFIFVLSLALVGLIQTLLLRRLRSALTREQ